MENNNKCLSRDEMMWQLNERLFVRGVSDPEDFRRWWDNQDHISNCEKCNKIYCDMLEYAESVHYSEGLVWDKFDEIMGSEDISVNKEKKDNRKK